MPTQVLHTSWECSESSSWTVPLSPFVDRQEQGNATICAFLTSFSSAPMRKGAYRLPPADEVASAPQRRAWSRRRRARRGGVSHTSRVCTPVCHCPPQPSTTACPAAFPWSRLSDSTLPHEAASVQHQRTSRSAARRLAAGRASGLGHHAGWHASTRGAAGRRTKCFNLPIQRPRVSGNADLLSEMVHHGEGHLLRRTREIPSILEELEQHGKPQARRAMLVLDQRPFSRDDCPVFH